MGRVFLAEDRWQQRQVALKLLPLAAISAGPAAALYQRFCREAQLLCRLRHPNLIELYDFYPSAGLLSMEYLPAGALAEAPRPLPLRQVRRIWLEVIDALEVVHAAGVLHRDLKPHNLFVSASGATKLADFGAASLRELGLTQTEGLVGTLAYMSPEQLRGDSLSAATDLYGLGVTIFELLTGALPFPGPDFIEQHLSIAPPDPRQLRPSLPAAWATVLLPYLAKQPTARGGELDSLRRAVAALPTPALADDSGEPAATAPPVPAAAAATATGAAPAAPVGCTSYSELYQSVEPQLGRSVLIERFSPSLWQSPAGVAQRHWLRGLAGFSGPLLQRLLRIDEQRAEVHYEAPPSWPLPSLSQLTTAEYRQTQRLLNSLHAAGWVHGTVAGRLVRVLDQPLLLLCGCGPLGWSAAAPPTAADDLRQLAMLVG
jgi:serine/threonine-protein kinase